MGQIQSDDDMEVELSDIQPLYSRFMKECPSGALHLHEFRKIFGVQSTSEDEAMYMETLFRSFDTNRVSVFFFFELNFFLHHLKMLKCNGTFTKKLIAVIAKQLFLCISFDYVHIWSAHQPKIICVHLQDDVIDFMEFVAAVHLVLRGNLEDRLKWSFKVYDRDDNGKLDKQEVRRIIRVRAVLVLTFLTFVFSFL